MTHATPSARGQPDAASRNATATEHLAGWQEVLVIGYGNELRGDDGLGPSIATAVNAWQRLGLRGLSCHQLAPELAEPIAAARLVIFVDAGLATLAPTVQARRIEPSESVQIMAHTGDAPSLLALAGTVFGRCPPAWSITVPAVNFEFGERLSPTAERGKTEALEQIRRLVEADEPATVLLTCQSGGKDVNKMASQR